MKPLKVHESTNYHPHALSRFNSDTTEHQMEILLDQGLYRHLRFKKPGTGMYYFDLITSPGLLTIRADMGTYVFSRVEDMFEFFTGNGYVNAGYWGEKLQATDSAGYRQHDEDLFKKWLIQYFWENRDQYELEDARSIWEAIRRDILSDYEWRGSSEACRSLIDSFRECGFEFGESWELNWDDYTFHYLWCCHAILAGIRDYRAYKAADDAA